jgi:hypothetical protein
MTTLFKGATSFAGSSTGRSLLGGSQGSLDGASSYGQYASNPTGYSGSF